MNILITGATGMVGHELVPELLRHGHMITVLARDSKSASAQLGAKVKVFAWDGLTGPPPDEALKGIEAVIHLAGEGVAGKRWTESRKQVLRDSRILSGHNLLEGLKVSGQKLKVFITASGVGFYGDRKDSRLQESEAAGSDFLARLCVEWEAVADEMPAERIVKARFGVVLKAGRGFLGEVVPMFKRFGASKLGDGKHWISWIHIDDLVDILTLALVDDRYTGAINTVAPEAVSNARMTDEIRRAIRAWPGPPAPGFALRLLYGEMADVLLFSQRAVPKKLEDLKFKFEFPKLNAAIEDLFQG
jgi:uncharacterized protein